MRENKKFIKLTQKKGISLIVLIVTIIVIIILAAVVILTITKNNPIENAKEATFKEDVRSFQDDLALFISKEYTDNQGQRDEKINSSGEDVKNYISSFTDKYVGKFIIENDKLVGTDELTKKEKEWANDLNVSTQGKASFNEVEWNIAASDYNCFVWDENTIVGYNEALLNEVNTLRIPSKCTSIKSDYATAWNGYRNFVGGITKIEIPETVTEIGDYAFAYFDKLTGVNIPNGVTSIGEYTFCVCSSLTNIAIPDSVTNIGEGAFSSCSSLINITIPNGVTSIGERTFSSCSSLTNIAISNSVTSIGIGAFTKCSSLTNIAIPNSVTSIGSMAFQYCTSLINITIPNSVTSIGEDAFYDCNSLTSIKFLGTMAEWNNISKAYNWKNASVIKTITCTDGTITL